MKKRRNGNAAGFAFIAFGISVIAVCVFPTKWMLVIIAVLLAAAGAIIMSGGK